MPAVIVSAVRTPIGGFQGALSPLSATELGAHALRAALARAPFPAAELDEVLMGNVVGAGLGQNPARQAAMGAGVPASVGATTLNKVCGSGLKAVMLADQAIRAGDARAFAVGGMESMTNAPYLLAGARGGYRLGNGELVDALLRDGLWDVYHDYHMGATAELVARERRIDRAAQDRYAARSYERALRAQETGAFDAEIVPVPVPSRKGRTETIERDESPRPTTLEGLAALPPVFDKGGTVTAGNSSKISDGAAALVVLSEVEAAARGIAPLARIVAAAAHAGDPEWIMLAPVAAIRNALARAALGIEQVDLFEINEPFAAASCAILAELALDPDRVNVHGGAVALGHPLGATGARILVSLLHALRQRGGRYGAAALCLGGGEAVALVVENVMRDA
jgi:acetyl-CoA C-acetyltransferase